MRPPIDLKAAAFWYEERLHQMDAWNYLQENVPSPVLYEFARLYRTDPSVGDEPDWAR